jgi:ParB-like chromosome segregation protein Spo0J
MSQSQRAPRRPRAIRDQRVAVSRLVTYPTPELGWSERAWSPLPLLVAPVYAFGPLRVLLGSARATRAIERKDAEIKVIELEVEGDAADAIHQIDLGHRSAGNDLIEAAAALADAGMPAHQIAIHLELCNRSEAARLISLKRLPMSVRRRIGPAGITLGHARLLLGAEQHEAARITDRCISQRWSVARLGQELGGVPADPDPNIEWAQRQLTERLAAAARVEASSSGVDVGIQFTSLGELLGVFERLGRLRGTAASTGVARELRLQLSPEEFSALIDELESGVGEIDQHEVASPFVV